MKNIKAFLLSFGVGVLGFGAMLTSCDYHSDDNPEGRWTSAAPQSVTLANADSTRLMKTISMDFSARENDKPGVVTLTAEYSKVATNATDSVSSKPYSVTATIQGTYTLANDEHDEYLLTFDKNSLSVKGTDAPELGPVTDDFLSSIATYTSIDDVEVTKDGANLQFETSSPKVKHLFVKK